MLCEKCKKNEASMHTVAIINGEKQEHHLCAACAAGMQYGLPSLMELLSGFGMLQQQAQESCVCGGNISDFQKTGLLHCPACYATFQTQLLPVIKRAQGGRTRHVGRRPAEYEELIANVQQAQAKSTPGCDEVALECARLRCELQEAVKEERYERAAELRDRLRLLEGGAGV